MSRLMKKLKTVWDAFGLLDGWSGLDGLWMLVVTKGFVRNSAEMANYCRQQACPESGAVCARAHRRFHPTTNKHQHFGSSKSYVPSVAAEPR